MITLNIETDITADYIIRIYLELTVGKMSDTAFCVDMEPLLRPSIKYNIDEAYEVFLKHFVEAM